MRGGVCVEACACVKALEVCRGMCVETCVEACECVEACVWRRVCAAVSVKVCECGGM